jgi:RNA polymerase sigma factor (sigma-70 family)
LIPDEEIIHGCKKGNRKAQQELFRKFSARMFGVCLRYSPSREDAEDLLHDGFVKVFDKIGSFKAESSLETWMSRVFVNEAISRIRKNKTRGGDWLTLDESHYNSADDEDDEVEADLNVEEVMDAVQRLPDKYRLIINLYAIEGKTHREIAELLGIVPGASKSQLSRARAMLRDILKSNNSL